MAKVELIILPDNAPPYDTSWADRTGAYRAFFEKSNSTLIPLKGNIQKLTGNVQRRIVEEKEKMVDVRIGGTEEAMTTHG